MGFDKNTVIGIALIMLIFFGFEIYNVKQQAEYEKTHPKSKMHHSDFTNLLCEVADHVSGGEITNFRTTDAIVSGSKVTRTKPQMIRKT